MRPFGMLLGLVVIPALLAAEQAGRLLSPTEAAKKVNEKVTVEMEVKSVGNKDNWFLNSESDYKSDKNFTVFIPKEVVEKFKKNKIEDPEAQFKGKTIQVTGTVILYEKKPEIKIEEPDQIKIVTKK